MRTLILVVVTSLAMAGCGKIKEKEAERLRSKQAEAAKWEASPDSKSAAISELTKGDTVKSASYKGTESVSLVVDDDGSDRSGLADWGCGVLREHEAVGAKSITVYVKNQDGRIVGDHTCKHHSLPY